MEATCTEPKTCSECGETEGSALGHSWEAATCTQPKTCSECGKTKGKVTEHTWNEATCTEPKICLECGITEGEASGHMWNEATCVAPKTCSKCNETEGEALGHVWNEATYWKAKTCSECGETAGEPLVASFEKYGLVVNVEEGKKYNYRCACYYDMSKETIGEAVFSDYRIVKEDATLGLERRDGYEWRIVTCSILFYDYNAVNYGISIGYSNENYYDIESWDESERYAEETGFLYYTVNYNGTEYECCLIQKFQFSDWEFDQVTWNCECYINVPVGYDGFVIGLSNLNTWEEGMYIYDVADENTLFFRMD